MGLGEGILRELEQGTWSGLAFALMSLALACAMLIKGVFPYLQGQYGAVTESGQPSILAFLFLLALEGILVWWGILGIRRFVSAKILKREQEV